MLKDKSFNDFLASSQQKQREFINGIKINELKETVDRLLLRKFIAMKVFMEARHAAEDKSIFNFTAQFRNILALFMPALKLGADYGPDPASTSKTGRGVRGPYFVDPSSFGGGDQPGEDKEDAASNGYRLFHVSQMGRNTWQRKFFNLGVDKENRIVTKKINTSIKPISGDIIADVLGCLGATSGPSTIHDDLHRWDLDNAEDLRSLFAEINNESKYDNSLGYDLYRAASFCICILFELSLENTGYLALILAPLALVVAVVVYAFVIPLSFALYAAQALLINPVQTAVDMLLPNEHETFINAVCTP
ncbi:MAG: hypothetical protein Q8R24_02755 [Legionellaceae bacterium]|nr:hypothetical protein [Legionellaceae bacterium]